MLLSVSTLPSLVAITHCDSGGMLLICLVNFCNHVFKGLCDLISENSSW